jgi:hypothetical protein
MKLIKKLEPHQLWLMLIAGLISLGQLQRIQLTNHVAIYVHDLAIFSWLLAWFLPNQKTITHCFTSLFRKLPATVFILLGWVVVGLVINQLRLGWHLNAWLYLGRLSMYFLFAYSLYQHPKISNSFFKLVLLYLGISHAVLGLLQYWFLPDTRFLRALGWDDHYYRLIGTLFDPAFIGIWLVMSFWFIQSLTKNKVILLSSRILYLVAIVLTFSRSSYLAFFLSGLLYVGIYLKKSHFSYLKWGGIIIFICLMSFGLARKPSGEGIDLSRTTSIWARSDYAQQALKSMTPLDWIIGRGVFTPLIFKLSKPNPVTTSHSGTVDNIWLFLVVYLGLPATLLTLVIVGHTGVFLIKNNPLLATVFISLLTHGLFNNTLFQPFIWAYWWIGVSALYKKPNE